MARPILLLMRKPKNSAIRVPVAKVEEFKKMGWHVDGMLNAEPAVISEETDGAWVRSDSAASRDAKPPHTLKEMRAIASGKTEAVRGVLLACLETLRVPVKPGATDQDLLKAIDAKLKELGA